MAVLTQPIKWHGGKYYLRAWILGLMPPHLHYVEPFFGGGGILLARDPNRDWMFDANDQNKSGKKPYLRSIQYYREFDNKLFPYIILKMNKKSYIKKVKIGYLNNDDLAFNTLQDFVSTLSNDIEIEKVIYPLRF